ncbi:hypothetical protein T4C_10977 [Trichinella pseudospiralis]|uniref:Uncharacterized protein n=1 Tax=Trichinella pseudospiralis TaxID=6337 RepID=A0A0V1GP82_TRIPS|nr:hypothetical protein T4C_10977 [Trichinella pseudospiralis]
MLAVLKIIRFLIWVSHICMRKRQAYFMHVLFHSESVG